MVPIYGKHPRERNVILNNTEAPISPYYMKEENNSEVVLNCSRKAICSGNDGRLA